MVRLSKLTDYALLVMTSLAQAEPSAFRAASDLSRELRLPLPTVSKVLKELLRSRLLVSHRGLRGGYSLVKDPRKIAVAEIVAALEGPFALTECSSEVTGLCEIEMSCAIKRNQQIISQAMRGVLEKLTLFDLVQPLALTAIRDVHGNLIPAIGVAPGRMQ